LFSYVVSLLVTYSDREMCSVSSEGFRSSHCSPLETVLCSIRDSNASLSTQILNLLSVNEGLMDSFVHSIGLCHLWCYYDITVTVFRVAGWLSG